MQASRLAVIRIATALGLLILALNSFAADDDPMAGFEPWIGGQWHLAGSYQELRWGPGRRSVIARSFSLAGEQPEVVSEGHWYWDPSLEQIRGTFVAVDMPVAVFDYTTRFEDGAMVSDLRAIDHAGNVTEFVEVWAPDGDDRFTWTLAVDTDKGRQTMMSDSYRRDPDR